MALLTVARVVLAISVLSYLAMFGAKATKLVEGKTLLAMTTVTEVGVAVSALAWVSLQLASCARNLWSRVIQDHEIGDWKE